LREFGSGAMAAASTTAFSDRNFGLAFMWLSLLCGTVLSGLDADERRRARLIQELNREERDGKVRVRKKWPGCCESWNPNASLRWHYPDQVQRVFLTHATRSDFVE
jgi:hypothetical protein